MKFLNKYGVIFIFLFLWEFLSRRHIINPLYLPPFTEILKTLVRLGQVGTLNLHVKASLGRAVPGFLLAVLIGVPGGLLLGGWLKTLSQALELPLEAFSQLNPFLLFHIIILFLGLGEIPKVAIVAWTCLWPIVFSSINGALNVPAELLKSGRVFGLSRLSLIRRVVWPAACPLILTGVRLSLGYSLFMLIAAEMMGASSGLGFMVLRSQEAFQLDRMYAFVTVIAMLGLILDGLMSFLTRRLLRSFPQAVSDTEN
jgi:NitT/TauT family transport system permease protein